MAGIKLRSLALAATLALGALSTSANADQFPGYMVGLDVSGSSYALGGAPISIHFEFTDLMGVGYHPPDSHALEGYEVFSVTGLRGTINGQAITGLSSYGQADNLFFFFPITPKTNPLYPTGADIVDWAGIAFTTTTEAYNFSWDPTLGLVLTDQSTSPDGSYGSGPVNSLGVAFDLLPADVVAIPLPGTLPLFATGLAGLGLMGWRKRRKAAAAV